MPKLEVSKLTMEVILLPGPGDKQLAKKRERMLFLDEKMRQEKNSQFVRRIEGIRIIQRGAIKTA